MLLIDSDLEMAEHVAERIEHRLRSDHGKPRLSVSVGMAFIPTTAGLLEESSRPLTSVFTTERKTQCNVALPHPEYSFRDGAFALMEPAD